MDAWKKLGIMVKPFFATPYPGSEWFAVYRDSIEAQYGGGLDSASGQPRKRIAVPVIAALADELSKSGALASKELFRAAATRVREKTGAKGQALFHPIRLALTGEQEGLELDLAVPLIEQGAALGGQGIRAIVGAADRAAAFLHELEKPGAAA